MTYYTIDGDKVTRAQIKEAVVSGSARIIYSYRPNGGLIEALSLFSGDFDTRGQNHQMSDDAWTGKPTLATALRVAGGSNKVTTREDYEARRQAMLLDLSLVAEVMMLNQGNESEFLRLADEFVSVREAFGSWVVRP